MSLIHLEYGSYEHDDCEAAVEISMSALFNEAGQKYATRQRWTIDGKLQAADQAALAAALKKLEAAYSTNGLDIGLYFEDGSVTSHTMDSGAAIGGVRIIEFGYPESGRGSAEYSTFRTYRIVAEADFPDTAVGLLSYHETLTFEGGGPRWIFLQPLAGPPQRQQVAQATPFRATQFGEAVGHLSRPLPNPPILPQAEHVDQRRIERPTPKATGPRGQVSYTEYAVRWSYYFESATPLAGNSQARFGI
jgi:hypothetical protein